MSSSRSVRIFISLLLLSLGACVEPPASGDPSGDGVSFATAVLELAALGASNFEIEDGNILVDGADPPALDWANVDETRVDEAPSGQTDDSFGQGAKEDTQVPVVVDGSIPPNKSEVKTFGVYSEENALGQYMHLYWTRVQDPSGTTNMDFEFNPSGELSANETTPVRTAGDLLVVYELSRGGTAPRLFLFAWLDGFEDPLVACEASNAYPCWGGRTDLTGSRKGTDPEGLAEEFGFHTDVATEPASSTTFSLFDGGAETRVNVLFGSGYVVTDDDLSGAGFDLASIDCVIGDNYVDPVVTLGERKISFDIDDSNDIVDCTFTNRARGTIIVEKQTDPNGAAGDFTFGGDVVGTISDGGSIVVSDLAPGTYTATETDPSGFDLSGIVCNDANSTGDVGSSTATFGLEPGETVKCTFTNQQRGTIIVEKQTHPDGAAGDLTFTGDVSGAISDGQTITVEHVPAGTYTSTESDPSGLGFRLDSIVCDDANSSGDPGSGTATFRVEAGETVKCTFTHSTGAIRVKKTAQHATLGISLQAGCRSWRSRSGRCGVTKVTSVVRSGPSAGGELGPLASGQSHTVTNLLEGTYTCVMVVDP